MPEADHLLLPSTWTCVSLRPKSQHHALKQACQAFGAQFFACSSLRLEKRASDADIAGAMQSDIVIATSPTAVKFARQSPSFALKTGARGFAIGPSTGKALKKMGFGMVHYANGGADSDALLAHPELQALEGVSVGLLTAPGGRGVLAPGLLARGARLQIAEVYQRTPIAISAAHLKRLADIAAPAAVFCSSFETFSALWAQLDVEQQQRLGAQHWVVSSERLAARLQPHAIHIALITQSAIPRIMFKAFTDAVLNQRMR
jgi:uroporphyrinogen-III synthase